jgi:predicted ribosome quality control (RQC) complex YloA/Tae2 family protein
MVDGGVGVEAGDWGTAQEIVVARIGACEAMLVRLRAPGTTRHVLVVSERRVVSVGLVGGASREMARAALRAGEPSRDADALRAALDAALVAGVADEGEALARGAELAKHLAELALSGARARVVKVIARAVERLLRRVVAIRGDLGRIAVAEEAAVQARLFVAEAAKAPRGARALSVVDWATGATITMPLDPAKGAREQLDAIFKRTKRLKDGARVGAERLAEAERTIAALRPLEEAAASAVDLAALEGILASARAAAPRDLRGAAQPAAGRRAKPAPTPPYRTFTSEGGRLILVGRGAAQNDALTLHVAKPHDLWLHVKGGAGAHVVVPLPKGTTCPGELLVDAAHLAAHFSGARDEAVTEVTYVAKRYVRKPRGSAPGLVVVEREKVLTLRRDAERMARLLAGERGEG